MIEPSSDRDPYREGQYAADLELWLHRREGAPHEATVTYRAVDSQAESDLGGKPCPEISLERADFLSLSSTSNLTDYGRALAKMVFADERLHQAFIKARSLAEGAQVPLRVRLRLDNDDPLLHSVRWEALLDPTEEPSPTFLCTQASTRFSRFFASPDTTPITPPERPSLTALVAIAAPNNLTDLGLDPIKSEEEQRIILPALEGFKHRVIPHTTLPTLIAELQKGEGVDILYLIAHGGIIDNKTYLYLEDEQGRVAATDGDSLVSALDGLSHRPLLIVLASCQSAGTSHDYGTARVALGPRLAEKGIGAVIAMHDNLAIATAETGFPVLFRQFQAHGCIDLAVAEMRAVLKAHGDDWWQPVLYMRLENGRLWRRPAEKTPESGSFIRISEIGPDHRETLRLKSYDDLITIGRKDCSDLQFPKKEPGVSWEHGQIIRQQGAYYYRHLSGSSTTHLIRRGGQEKFLFKPKKPDEQKEEMKLENQDQLMIGQHLFAVSHTLIDEYQGYIATPPDYKDLQRLLRSIYE